MSGDHCTDAASAKESTTTVTTSGADSTSPALTRSKRLRELTEAETGTAAEIEPKVKRERLESPDREDGLGKHPEIEEKFQESESSQCRGILVENQDDIPGDATSGEQTRWRAHQMAEDYIELATNIMLAPLSNSRSYGFDPSSLPLEAVSVLGYLKSPARIPMIIERWSPYEIAVFEGALAHHGKDFFQVGKAVGSKTTKECIDFYYVWKKTVHYKKWKQEYVPPHSLDEGKNDNTERR